MSEQTVSAFFPSSTLRRAEQAICGMCVCVCSWHSRIRVGENGSTVAAEPQTKPGNCTDTPIVRSQPQIEWKETTPSVKAFFSTIVFVSRRIDGMGKFSRHRGPFHCTTFVVGYWTTEWCIVGVVVVRFFHGFCFFASILHDFSFVCFVAVVSLALTHAPTPCPSVMCICATAPARKTHSNAKR